MRGRVRSPLRPARAAISLAVVAGLLVAVPSQSATAAAVPPVVSATTTQPGAGTTRAAPTQVVRLRAAASPQVQAYGPERAAAVIEDLVTEQRRQVTVRQVLPRRTAGVPAPGKQTTRIVSPRTKVNAQLQAALAALGEALSTSQCKVIGAADGRAASISCPLAAGRAALGSSPTPNPAPTVSASPTAVATTTPPAPDPVPTPGVTPSGTEDPQPLFASSPAFMGGSVLDDAGLQQSLRGVLAEWATAGADVRGITAGLADLPGAQLGETSGRRIVIDPVAGGWGWDRMDLATVVRHETGHALGLGHTATGLMAAVLHPGTRLATPSRFPREAAAGLGAPMALTGEDDATQTADAPADEVGPADQVAEVPQEPADKSEPQQEPEPEPEPEHASPAADPTPEPAPEAEPEPAPEPEPEPAPEPTPENPSAAPSPDTDSGDDQEEPPAPEPVRGRWIIAGATAKLIVEAGDGDGRLFYDSARDELVFRVDGVDNRVSADGIRWVVVKGDAAADLTVDLRSFPRGRGRIEVDIETSHDNVDVVSDVDVEVDAPPPADAGNDAANRLLISSLLAILRIAAPQFAARIEAIGSNIVVTGHIDLTETGARLELTAQRVSVENAEILTTGAVTLTAIASSQAAADALVSLRNATIFGGEVSITATADGQTSATAVVSVTDSRIVATGAVDLTADATLTADGGGTLRSVADAHLVDSVVTTRADLSITARNATTVEAVSGTDAAVNLTKLTSATIGGLSRVDATAALLTAVATGQMDVTSAGDATVTFASTTEAGLAPGARLVLSRGDLVARATSRHLTRVKGKGVVVAITNSRTLAALAKGAVVSGGRGLRLIADSTDVTTATGGRGAIVSSAVQTRAGLAADTIVTLTGDLELVAVQAATAIAEGAGLVLVLADHGVATEILGSAIVGGDLVTTVEGVSLAAAPLTADNLSLATAPLTGAARFLAAAPDATCTQLPNDAPAPVGAAQGVSVAPVGLTVPATGNETLEAAGVLTTGAGSLAAGGTETCTVAAGSGTAFAGAGSTAPVTAVTPSDTTATTSTGTGSQAEPDAPVVDYSGRGPPASANRTRALVIADHTCSRATPTTLGPAGAVLTAPRATRSSATGALPLNAWVIASPRSATVSAPSFASPVSSLSGAKLLPVSHLADGSPFEPGNPTASGFTPGSDDVVELSTHPAAWGGLPGGFFFRVLGFSVQPSAGGDAGRGRSVAASGFTPGSDDVVELSTHPAAWGGLPGGFFFRVLGLSAQPSAVAGGGLGAATTRTGPTVTLGADGVVQIPTHPAAWGGPPGGPHLRVAARAVTFTVACPVPGASVALAGRGGAGGSAPSGPQRCGFADTPGGSPGGSGSGADHLEAGGGEPSASGPAPMVPAAGRWP